MKPLIALARGIDALNARIGKLAAWLILVAVFISAINAIVRKLFDVSSNSWLELQWVLFSAVFLLCASWTLRDNEHIRIDILNSHFSKRTRDGIDIFGHLFFLLPFSLLILWTSVPFFITSWDINEQSLNVGGLPQWPAKLLIPVGFFLLTLQTFSELIKRVAVITGQMEDPRGQDGGEPALDVEAERLMGATVDGPHKSTATENGSDDASVPR
ncbi:MAG: TRAP transporter small permease subunit [Xanthobacter sp.]